MLSLSFTEENYLKSIYSLQNKNENNDASVNEISATLNTRPATVTDMLKKLSEKELINYEKYKRTSLTPFGYKTALSIVRKHRLWEVFLYQHLNFSWDEVHEIAEELEHIQSPVLIEKLDKFLGYPSFDPHGDPIPTADGKMKPASNLSLIETKSKSEVKVVAVSDTSSPFLQHLEKINIQIGTNIILVEKFPFDNSVLVNLHGKEITLSEKIAKNLLVILL